MAFKSSFSRGINSSTLNRYVLEMFFCIFFSIILMGMSISRSNIIADIKYFVITSSKPGLIFASKPFLFIKSSAEYFSRFKTFESINNQLENENAFLRNEFNKINLLQIENHRLKSLLKLQDVDYVRKVTARIIIDGYRNDDSLMYIDAGKNNGLKINDLVFNENGLLGRITEVGAYSSKVLTIYDRNSVIPGISVKTKNSVFLQGDVDKLRFKHLEKKFKLDHGELIISTDAAGYFKEGIIVGKVVKSLNDVYVESAAKRTDSIFVNVLIFDFKKIFID